MNEQSAQDASANVPDSGSNLIMYFVFPCWFGLSTGVFRALMGSQRPSTDTIEIGLLTILSAAISIPYAMYRRRLAARSASSKVPSKPRKRLTKPGRRLGTLRPVAFIVPCGLIAYLVLVGVFAELTSWSRQHSWSGLECWAQVLNGLFMTAIIGLEHQGTKFARALERWPGRQQDQRMTVATRSAEPLWDRDLNLQFEVEARPVS